MCLQQKLSTWLQPRQKWKQVVAFNIALFALLCVTKKLYSITVKLQSAGNEKSNQAMGLSGGIDHTKFSYSTNLNVHQQFHLNIFDYDSFKTAPKEDAHESELCVETSVEVTFL